MKNHLIFKWLFSILLIAFTFSSRAQEQPVEQTEPKQEELVTYKISEIPSKLEETQAYLAKLNTEIISEDKVAESEKELETVNNSYRILRLQTDSVSLEDEYSTTLKEFQQKWIANKKKINDWAGIVTSRTEKLDEAKKALLDTKEIWNRTYRYAREEKAPAELLNSIRELITALNITEKDLTKEINLSLSLQTKLSEQNIDVDLTMSKIESLLKEKERDVFSQNAPTIWESFSTVKDSTGLSVQFSKIWKSYLRTADEYIENNKDRIIEDFILFLFFLIIIYTLRFFSKNIKEKDEKESLALKLLERPISTAILVFLLFTLILYEDAPEIFLNILRILVVLPLLRVLIHILKPVLTIPLFYFCGLIIVQQFMRSAGSGTPVERALLFVITILTLIGLLWFILKKVPTKAFEKIVDQSRAMFISKLLLLMMGLAFVANVLGYIMLGVVIVNGILNSTYGIIFIVTAALALNALIIISLQTKPLQKFNVVRNQAIKIKSTTAKIIKVVVFIWSLSIILNNFFIRDEVIGWLEGTLGKVWEIGNLNISIGNILLFFISIWLAVQIARFVRFILEGDVLPRLNLARGVPGAISSIMTYLIIGFGIIIAMITAGIDLSSFALLAGALGVGIGFGLQDIVRNFISGLILIFERPIQIGDAVQVDDISGRVLKIGIRSSIIKTWQGAEVIVPNGNLISNKLVNWTLSDQLRRIDIKTGVSYGTDVKLVMQTLLMCATDHQQILTKPSPYVLFNDFAESYLEFELRCWTSNYTDWIFIKSEIMVAIDEAFAKEEIIIPFPQRDLHLKSGFDFPAPDSENDK
ncbi:MAG: mechanosensitive ion channel [Ignavibacteria bacterium]|nr:mechanosensitive ion channel [Ignavibacteria bacterium]